MLEIKEGATKDKVFRASQIPHPKMPMKVDDPSMLIPIIPMGRPIPPPDETTMLPQSRPAPRQEVNPAVTIVNPS